MILKNTVFGGLFLTVGTAGIASVENAEERPNILFCLADDASFPHMSAYGCSWVNTPGFDLVAREGLLFNNAYTPNGKCAPSRACILTGRNPWQLEAAANHWCFFPEKFRTYCEALSDSGYYVGYTEKGWAPGIADGRLLTGKDFSSRKTPPPTAGIPNEDYAGNFVDFLDSRPDNTPFCFWYGSHEPHREYEFGSGIRKGGKSLSDLSDIPDFFPDNPVIRTDLLDYAYEIEYFDDHLVRMLNTLEARGELENTIVVVTSDNGMPFPRGKGQSYEYSTHIPLSIMWKAGIQEPGRVIDEYVSFIDLAPTFLDISDTDAAETGMAPLEGKSLRKYFNPVSRREADREDYVLLGRERHDVGRPHDRGYPVRGIVKDGWMYLRNMKPSRWPAGNPETGYMDCDGSPTKTLILNSRQSTNDYFWKLSFGKHPPEELYYVARDRDCVVNLIDDPRYSGLLDELRGILDRELTRQRDPRMTGEGDLFDAYPFAHSGLRMFYERFMSGETIRTPWINPSDYEPDFPER